MLRLPRAPQACTILETTSANSAQQIAPRVLTGLEHAPPAKLHSLSTQTVPAHARHNNILTKRPQQAERALTVQQTALTASLLEVNALLAFQPTL